MEQGAIGLLPSGQLNIVRIDKQELTDARPRTLYLRRDVLNGDDIVKWARAQGLSPVPADEMHVTIVHSRAPVDWIEVGEDYPHGGDDGRMHIAPGGPRLVEQFKGGVLVLQFASSRLAWRHEEVMRRGGTHDFPEYQPHITVAQEGPADVEPYRGAIELGPEVFEEIEEGAP